MTDPEISADILIVEDEEAHAEAMDEGLKRLGHRCTVVHDGASAVAKISASPFDIIVTDLRLGISTAELAHRSSSLPECGFPQFGR